MTQHITSKHLVGVSDLARIREEIKLLVRQEQQLVTILKELGPGVYSEDSALAVVMTQSRRLVDVENLRLKYPEQVREFTSEQLYLVVKTTRVS